MRKIAANIIITANNKPLKQSYIAVQNDGTIIKTVDTKGQIPEIAGLEYYSGIIIPGLIVGDAQQTITTILSEEEINANKKLRLLWLKGIQAISFKNLNQRIESINPMQILLKKQEEKRIKGSELIKEFTITAARHFNLDKQLGSIEHNKRPGIILISNYDIRNDKFTTNSTIKRII